MRRFEGYGFQEVKCTIVYRIQSINLCLEFGIIFYKTDHAAAKMSSKLRKQ